MRDVLETLETWVAEGKQVATATVVRTERSAPRDPGAVFAVSGDGDVAGSVTGGCVEPAVYEEAQDVLGGGSARLVSYGIADEQAFEVGLPCGGTVDILIERLDPAVLAEVGAAVRAELPIAVSTQIVGDEVGGAKVVTARTAPEDDPALRLLARGENGTAEIGDSSVFVSSFVPRPRMYVFGAIDFASAVASVGKFLGFHVTVCDARAKFVTKERFPDADELVVQWPDEFLRTAPIDERTAVCVLTHDDKFDVPILKVALESPAGYIGAMGSRRTTEKRLERMKAEGVDEEQVGRIHAPIGLKIGARSPEEVAVTIAAQIIQVFRADAARVSDSRSRMP